MDSIEDSFVENHVPLQRIQKSIKHIPVSLKFQLGEYFRDQTSKILNTKSIQELFVLLSDFWDYLNPGILEFLVKKFAPRDTDIKLLQAYLKELKQFRLSVKVGDYVCVRSEDSDINHTEINQFFYKKAITIMGHDWEERTLQDLEEFKVKLFLEFHFQPFLARVDVRRSSIAIIIYFPCWIELNTRILETFFRQQNVIKVYLEDDCLFDWTQQVLAMITRIL